MTDPSEPRLTPAEAPWLADPECRTIIQALGEENARFVGGAVRDALLGLPAPDDLDIATRLPPEEVMRRLAAHGFHVVPTGLAHGTVTAVGADGRHYEITTLRVDVETDGRHATVAFTTDWQADAARRDFTINALYCDLSGRIYDYFDGLTDLRAGRVRFIGDAHARIREDALRILRFFRFHAWYGHGRPDAAGLAACAAQADMLNLLSIERVRDELLKLLAAPDPGDALAAMAEISVLGRVLPRAVPTRVALLARLCRREPAFTSLLDEAEEQFWRPLRRLFLLCPLGRQEWEQEGRRLRLSRRRIAALATLAEPLGGHDETALRRAIYRHGLAATANRAMIEAAELDDDKARQLARTLLALRKWQPPRFPVSGRDLIAAGFSPGPLVGTLLRQLEEEWLASGCRLDRQALLARARSLGRSGASGPDRHASRKPEAPSQ
ncbi:MAG: CCA tRNA nucleotidyltransferase [Alphaproteobacteria bacterium]|nr:MAG: CCA tRNA nucleotidyltransferase [Alphaproteobacteria bacterium]